LRPTVVSDVGSVVDGATSVVLSIATSVLNGGDRMTTRTRGNNDDFDYTTTTTAYSTATVTAESSAHKGRTAGAAVVAVAGLAALLV
jgi:hypothetical protein